MLYHTFGTIGKMELSFVSDGWLVLFILVEKGRRIGEETTLDG